MADRNKHQKQRFKTLTKEHNAYCNALMEIESTILFGDACSSGRCGKEWDHILTVIEAAYNTPHE